MLASKGAYIDVSDRRMQVQLTRNFACGKICRQGRLDLSIPKGSAIHLQEAKIASDFYFIRAIFAFVGFVSALSRSRKGAALFARYNSARGVRFAPRAVLRLIPPPRPRRRRWPLASSAMTKIKGGSTVISTNSGSSSGMDAPASMGIAVTAAARVLVRPHRRAHSGGRRRCRVAHPYTWRKSPRPDWRRGSCPAPAGRPAASRRM